MRSDRFSGRDHPRSDPGSALAIPELKPANGDSAELIEEDGELALQDRTDAMACTTKAGDNLAMVGHGLTHAPDGYYLLRALGLG